MHLPTTWSKPFETGWCVEYAAKVSRRGYILAEADLTLKKAVELAQGMEAAERNAKSLKGIDSAVQKVSIATDRPLVPMRQDQSRSKGLQISGSRMPQLWKTWAYSYSLQICQEAATSNTKDPQSRQRRSAATL